MTILRRPETPGDEPFLQRLIVETVTQELGASAWPQPMRDHLLPIQCRSRRAGARTQYPESSSQIVVADGEDAGWLFVADLVDEIRIVEIVVLAGYRGRGIGAAVIGEVLAAAGQAGKPVRLVVNAANSGAIRLYERLGFRQVGSDQVQHQMEWTALDLRRRTVRAQSVKSHV